MPFQSLLLIARSVIAFENDLPRFFASQTLISDQPTWAHQITYRILSNYGAEHAENELAHGHGT